MSRKQYFIGLLFASIIGGLIALGAFKIFEKDETPYDTFEQRQYMKLSSLSLDTTGYDIPEGLNFVESAKLVTPGVVHVSSTVESQGQQYRHPWEDFFNYPAPRGPRQASGSGVIISDDGYIATNNHVIDNAIEVEVTLFDNRKYKASIIGTDPNTDLALLKIEEEDLNFIRFGDSDKVMVGEWVLAVGNPFNLTSTVTAGIVSAKARNIRISGANQYGIEAFIQTDAAVNPGNSGGALVNLNGELIGINTAIASNTGSYAGYSFAVPVSLVKKVMNDLKEFGAVQRPLLGITIRDVTAEDAEDLKLKEVQGVYVNGVNSNSSAEDAGIVAGDVIVAIENRKVKNVSELQEAVALNRPGDKIKVTYIRDGKEKTATATLKNMAGDVGIVRVEGTNIENATCVEIDDELKDELNLKGGVQLKNIKNGKWKEAGIKEDFIITSVDKREILSINDLMAAISRREGGSLIGGVYPDGESAYYGIGW